MNTETDFQEFEEDELEMPTPCQKCGDIFDLTDGTGSVKWFPNTVICEKCGNEEEKEIERDEEIEELKSQIDDASYTLREARARLFQLGIEFNFQITEPNYK